MFLCWKLLGKTREITLYDYILFLAGLSHSKPVCHRAEGGSAVESEPGSSWYNFTPMFLSWAWRNLGAAGALLVPLCVACTSTVHSGSRRCHNRRGAPRSGTCPPPSTSHLLAFTKIILFKKILISISKLQLWSTRICNTHWINESYF